MSLTLTLHTTPDVPLEAGAISPDTIKSLDGVPIESLEVLHGNDVAVLGDFFNVTGHTGNEIVIEGDLSKIKHIGACMSHGRLTIYGNVGAHLAANMKGGEIIVHGDAGDWVAPEMTGGRIIIMGNAGYMVGSAPRGSTIGMQGGEIIIHGNVRNETGNTMRRGLIAIGGDSGDYTGVNMLAGTIAVLGKLGLRSGAGMQRGSIVSLHNADLLPTFTYACTYRPIYLRMLMAYLQSIALPVHTKHINGQYNRWSGDSVELNRGEILLYAD